MTAIAWLLNFGDGELAAVGERELLHLLPLSESFELPRVARHCRRVLVWQNRVVPIWDVLGWLRPGRSGPDGSLVAVIGHQSRRGQAPRFGALVLVEPPRRIEVSDSQACDLVESQAAWHSIAISCFCQDGIPQPVPVLDLPLMYSTAWADSTALHEVPG